MGQPGNGDPSLDRTGSGAQTPQFSANQDRLDSWKEIAAYLKRSVRTVQRWESERGLPVHRIPGGEGTSVTALKSEIDEWLQTAGELQHADHLEEHDEDDPPASGPGERGSRKVLGAAWLRFPDVRTRAFIGVSLVTGMGIGALIIWMASSTIQGPRQGLNAGSSPKHFTITPEHGFKDPVISPDGSMIAYVSGDESHQIAIHSLKTGNLLRAYPRTEGAQLPFWSPDSKFVGFAAGRYLRKLAAEAGTVSNICTLPTRMFLGGTWSANGKLIYFDVFNYPKDIYVVHAGGGAPQRYKIQSWRIQSPYSLTDARGRNLLLFERYVYDRDHSTVQGRIGVHEFGTGDSHLIAAGLRPIYSKTGHLLFLGADGLGTLWAQPFDGGQRSLTSQAIPVAKDVAGHSVSDDGTLVYQETRSSGNVQLVMKDREDRTLQVIGEPQPANFHVYPELSSDDQRVALRGIQDGEIDIYTYDIGQKRKERFTSAPEHEGSPIWSPSDDHIIYITVNDKRARTALLFDGDLLIKPTDQSANPEPLLATEYPEFSSDWSRDGKTILTFQIRPHEDGTEHGEIWYLRREGPKDEFVPNRYLGEQEIGCCAKFSPNADYIVYSSDETGTLEVYVSPFPIQTWKRRISNNGGRQPRWSHDGKEIFYVEGDMLVSVQVSTSPAFELGDRTALFRSDAFARSFFPQYDVTRDGKRFVLNEPVPGEDMRVIHVLLNWFEKFR